MIVPSEFNLFQEGLKNVGEKGENADKKLVKSIFSFSHNALTLYQTTKF